MIDIHTHFLPGVDDGPNDILQSQAMLRESFLQNVTLCVATPHCVVHKNDDINSFLLRRKKGFQRVFEAVKGDADDFPRILSGAEVYMDNDLTAYPDISKLCIQDTKCMLIEFPMNNSAPRMAEWIYKLSLKGITPIIAHIDRYGNNSEILEELKGVKVIYQINASKLLSLGGKSYLKRFIKSGLNIMASSDMHNTTYRSCNMLAAYNRIKKHFGSVADDIFCKNADRIINLKEV